MSLFFAPQPVLTSVGGKTLNIFGRVGVTEIGLFFTDSTLSPFL